MCSEICYLSVMKITGPDIKAHPKFPLAISKHGVIYSIKTGQPRRLWKTRHGYMQLSVQRTSYLAHRLIADVWVENPLNKPVINHKNGIKDDNRAENLEWVTQHENIIHARDVLGVKYSLPGFENSNARVTEKEIRMMIRLYELGLPFSKISKVLEYPRQTIKAHLRKYEQRD